MSIKKRIKIRLGISLNSAMEGKKLICSSANKIKIKIIMGYLKLTN